VTDKEKTVHRFLKNTYGPIRTVLASAFAITALAGPVVVLDASPAGALTITSNVNVRPCVDLNNPSCAPVGSTGTVGISKLRCWRDASWATGNYNSNRWFLILLKDGREGYVHSSFVGQQTSTPNCTTLHYVRAADWAIAQIGQAYAPASISRNYSDWPPGPIGEWSGDCAKFAHAAYAYGAGTSFPRGNAIGQYRHFRDRGQIIGGLPRYGSPVFYNVTQYGHVAIYIGGTTIVTTRGLDNHGLTVARADINSFANYLGWAPA
jgi:hypothetical protein